MSSILGWNGHANNFSISFMELLHEKELVDVTLVTDGNIFSAHRLILSALSPQFRKMFKEMPVNQHAYVIMDDIPKQTMENLIKYIYNGEVEIQQDFVADFLKKAKSLQIDGISDGHFWQAIDQNQPASSKPNYHSSHGPMQYQTTQVNRVHASEMVRNKNSTIIANGSAHQSNTNTTNGSHQYPNGSMLSDASNGSAHDAYESNGNYEDDSGLDSGMEYIYCDVSTDQVNAAEHLQWGQDYDDAEDDDDEDYYVNQRPAAKKSGAPANKRSKSTNDDISAYDIVADIRSNGRGGENLFHTNVKFNKHSTMNVSGQQRWQCTKSYKKCRAACSTMKVNGIRMMKVLVAEHSHELMN